MGVAQKFSRALRALLLQPHHCNNPRSAPAIPFIHCDPLNVGENITFPFYIHLLQVQITRRLTFKETTCTRTTIITATLCASQLACQRGCSGNIGGSTLNCTDFMTSTVTTANGIGNWSAGEETYTYNLSTTEPYFEAL